MLDHERRNFGARGHAPEVQMNIHIDERVVGMVLSSHPAEKTGESAVSEAFKRKIFRRLGSIEAQIVGVFTKLISGLRALCRSWESATRKRGQVLSISIDRRSH
jgi:hypothetical protein